MKLFAIRIENGETAIVLAENREGAIKEAGLTEDVFQQLERQGDEPDVPELVDEGFGPQLYELIELNSFHIRLSLARNGDYFISDIDEPTYCVLSALYPILGEAINEMVEKFGLQIATKHRPEFQHLLEDAISRERTRLMLPRESEPM